MATVDLGRIKFVWQGTYNAATAYVVDDVVYSDGSAYVCILASTGNAPTNTTYWNKMAQGSDLGSLSGLAQGDIFYYNGTDFARLGAGTSGQFLKTQGASANPTWADLSAEGRLIGMEVLGPYATISGSGNAATQFDQRTGATGTWTRPAGCNSVLVYVTGGGGGAMSVDSDYRGGAGGGGGTAIKFITNVASSVSWTVGAGGQGRRGGEGSTPNSGGTSSFGSYCSGFGGEGGQGGAGGQYGASGGGATGGDLNIPGGGGAFNHTTAQDLHGGMSFWTQAGSQHTNTANHTAHGKMGSGGGGGQSVNNVDRLHGGAGVIVVYEYS